MDKAEILNFNFVKEKYKGVLEIYPSKCTNTKVLYKVLHELEKDYTLVKVFEDWIRAFKK